MKTVLEQKKNRIANLFQRKKTDKVPIYLMTDGYLVYHAGSKHMEISNYDQALEISKKALLDLNVDAADGYTPYHVWLKPTFELLGGAVHRFDENGVMQIIPSDIKIMEPEEYPELIKDPARYLIEKVYPRRYTAFQLEDHEEKYNRIAKAFGHLGDLGTYVAKVEEECDTVAIANSDIYNPIDYIFDLLRNFDGIMRDIRKCPEDLRDAGLAMTDQILQTCTQVQAEPFRAVRCPMHLPPFIKPKDFEKVYWPVFKKLTYGLVEQGHNVVFLFEKNYSHLHDFLQELPKKNVLGFFEEDDLKVVKKNLGSTMAFGGGLSPNLLSFGTKQECIDHTKWLIDEIACDDGFMIAPTMPLTFQNDARPENLKAVIETIATYGMK